MTIENRSRIIVFLLSFFVWLALTPLGDIQELIAGIFVALIVSAVAGKFLVTTEKSRNFFKRIFTFVLYFFKFLWEMIKANVHVAGIVLNPTLPIRPGIIKIRTNLTRDSAITMLTNSITLTPGTLTVDVNPDKQEIYIHCIEVDSTDTDVNTHKIGDLFEPLIKEVFE